MPHETALIATMAVSLVFAAIAGFVAIKLHLPPLVGYLLAGVIVGPFTPGFVADPMVAQQLAEIGVILLMFGVGMHFSIRDLWNVRKIALPGAIAQIMVATGMGVIMAKFWGWSFGAGLVFGLALSVASTVVLMRALESQNQLKSQEGRMAIGWLVVEDLIMVLVLVLLPAVAGPLGSPTAPHTGTITYADILMTIAKTLGKVGIFVALMLVIGKRLFPWMLKRVEQTGSRELFTLAVIALSLGVAFGSAKIFGISFALGAFFAGMVINGSAWSRRAKINLLPMQDAFGVLFFVAVGMLFNPTILLNHPFQVLMVLLIIVVGKSMASLAIVRLLGYPMKTALLVSASLAQIGEFSFILAGIGVSMGLLPLEGQNLLLAGALLSITLNPVVFYAASKIKHE